MIIAVCLLLAGTCPAKRSELGQKFITVRREKTNLRGLCYYSVMSARFGQQDENQG
jgi:hypothetical protein